MNQKGLENKNPSLDSENQAASSIAESAASSRPASLEARIRAAQANKERRLLRVEELCNNDDTSIADLKDAQARLSAAMDILAALERQVAPHPWGPAPTADARSTRPPEKTPRLVLPKDTPFDLSAYLSAVERMWSSNHYKDRGLWAQSLAQFIDDTSIQAEYCDAMGSAGSWSWEQACAWLRKRIPQGDVLSAHLKRFLSVRVEGELTSVFLSRFATLMKKAEMSSDFADAHVRQLICSHIFLQALPPSTHQILRAGLVSPVGGASAQEAATLAPISLLEVPVATLMEVLLARLGNDAKLVPERPKDSTARAPDPTPTSGGASSGKPAHTYTRSASQPRRHRDRTGERDRDRDDSTIVCLSCKSKGHRATACPTSPMTHDEVAKIRRANELASQLRSAQEAARASTLNALSEQGTSMEEVREAKAQKLAILQKHRVPPSAPK